MPDVPLKDRMRVALRTLRATNPRQFEAYTYCIVFGIAPARLAAEWGMPEAGVNALAHDAVAALASGARG